MDAPVGPTKLGKIVGFLFIVVCVVAAGYIFRKTLFPTRERPGTVAKPGPGVAKATLPTAAGQKEGPEAPDTEGVTTVKPPKEYLTARTLPPVKGVSNYKWDPAAKIVQFPINIWIGWLPIVAANHGFAPSKESTFFKNYGFQVNLKLIDDPVVARDSFASGESHILWGTVDMMALFAPELMKDSRTAPRIFQQIDWSSGGDGIVVRSSIATVKDLKGKNIAYAQNSPSQYFLANLLIKAGIQPAEVRSKYTGTAFEAAAAFVADRSIDGCVSWAPDIYRIPEKVKGTRILTTTAAANKVIADTWAARADFVRDHADTVEGLVKGIFEGMRMLKNDVARGQALQWLADGYGMSVDEVKGMVNDAHITNFAENKEFFLNPNSPVNFERTWKNINSTYVSLGLIGTPVRFDEVVDASVIRKLEEQKMFADEVGDVAMFPTAPPADIRLRAEKILTQTIRINFYPNSSNIYEPRHDDFGNAMPNTLYDPNADATIEAVAKTAGMFARSVIEVIGHTDSSMKSRVPRDAVEKLSKDRANAVVDALIKKYKFDPNKFLVRGMAWDEPFDRENPQNQALNRRVEISVYSPEEK